MAVNNLIIVRKGIATEWSSQNPTLASGEPGYDGTNNLLKIGDGNTSWSGLPPANFPSNGLEGQILSKISDSSETLQWIDNYANELRATVQNNTASDISLGTVVMATGATGDNINVAPAVANGSVEAKYILGVAAETISSEGGLGYISVFGPLNHLNTNSYDVGTVLYIDPSAAGGWTATEPTSPNLAIPFAIVTKKNASAGRIFIRMWPQQEGLHELHDVNIDSVVNGDGIKYNSSTDTWIPDTDIVHGTGTQNYVAVWTSDQLLTSGIIYDNGTNVGIGTASPSQKLDIRYPAGGGMALIKDSDSNDGLLFGDMAYSVSNAYQGIKHVSMIGTSDYMMMSAGTDNHVSAKAGSDLYLRGGGNSTTSQIKLTASEININDFGSNCDFRIEGDTDQNLFFCDASSDNIGIGTTTLPYKLNVNGDIGLTDSGFYASPTGVMVGTSGWLYNDGQTTLSHGNFTDNGDAQNSSYVLRTSTTNDTFTTLQNNTADVKLASNRTMMFTANIVARRTNGQDNAAYKIEGVLVNDGYGASILGTPVKTILYESDSTWDVQAILSGGGAGASDYLLIQGKGATSKNINWVCKLDLLEVGGDITGYTESNALGIQENIIP